MTAYIAISFSKRKMLEKEVEAITEVIQSAGITSFVFVDNFLFDSTQEKEMMQMAMRSIDEADLLIAETSDKAIGIGIEAGYAKAKGKPLIYLRYKNAEHSTTLSGISDFQVIYNDVGDLKVKLSSLLPVLKEKIVLKNQ